MKNKKKVEGMQQTLPLKKNHRRIFNNFWCRSIFSWTSFVKSSENTCSMFLTPPSALFKRWEIYHDELLLYQRREETFSLKIFSRGKASYGTPHTRWSPTIRQKRRKWDLFVTVLLSPGEAFSAWITLTAGLVFTAGDPSRGGRMTRTPTVAVVFPSPRPGLRTAPSVTSNQAKL